MLRLTLPRIFLGVAIVLSAGAQAQTAYRWVDRAGNVHYSDQPPPADAGAVQEKRLQGSVVDTSGLGYEMQRAVENFPVTLYTSTDCGNPCDVARGFLGRRKIPYTEKVLKNAEDFAAFKAATGLSDPLVPILSVGDKSSRGYLESDWKALLDAAGYPASGR